MLAISLARCVNPLNFATRDRLCGNRSNALLASLMKSEENTNLNTVMSNNFGSGGTNASIVFQRYGEG